MRNLYLKVKIRSNINFSNKIYLFINNPTNICLKNLLKISEIIRKKENFWAKWNLINKKFPKMKIKNKQNANLDTVLDTVYIFLLHILKKVKL